jgi:nucleoside-diphosphate-sugar epimerase
MEQLSGKKILVTGVTGWVAGPVATSLAANNEVYGAARFADPAQREPFESAGVRTISIDLGNGRFDEVPHDLDYVLHFAVSKDPSWAAAFAANAHGSASLLYTAAERSSQLAGFFHCSSTGVYLPNTHEPVPEDGPLGDSHAAMGMTTYSISKIAGEVCVADAAKRTGTPAVIARLSVPYGDSYGWMTFHLMMMEHGMAVPVHVDAPSTYTPIHDEDIQASIPYLLSAATPDTPAINWGGGEVVSIEEWCGLLAEMTGLSATFEPTTATVPAIVPELSKLRATGFTPKIGIAEGLRRQLAAMRPDLLKN